MGSITKGFKLLCIINLYIFFVSGCSSFEKSNPKSFLEYAKRKETIEFYEITKPLLKKFERNFIIRGFKGDRTMRGLKALYSKAIEDEVIDMKVMPFKTAYNPIGYKFTHLRKIKKKSNLIKRLSRSQVTQLFEYIPRNESEQKALDLWKFSYFTMGVNLKDIALMKYVDIQDGLWFYDRSKTDNSSLGKPMLPETMNIIQRYYSDQNKYVFQYLLGEDGDISDKRINERIRDICSNLRRRYMKISKSLGFNGHFTFYSARYTSATISANNGGDMRSIQANLTHASLTTTEIYSQFRNEEGMRKSLEILRPQYFS